MFASISAANVRTKKQVDATFKFVLDQQVFVLNKLTNYHLVKITYYSVKVKATLQVLIVKFSVAEMMGNWFKFTTFEFGKYLKK